MNSKVNPTLNIDAAGIALLLALSAAFYFLAMDPLLDRQSVRLAQNEELARKRQQAAAIGAQLNTTRSRLASARELVDQSTLKLQTAVQLNQRAAELMALADACSMQVHEIHPKPAVHRDRFDVIPIHLSGTGAYRDAARFMHELHKTHPDVGIAGFELAGNPGDPRQPATFKLIVSWHIAPSLSAAAPR
jgi:Tfp pilus assembly protein PilO